MYIRDDGGLGGALGGGGLGGSVGGAPGGAIWGVHAPKAKLPLPPLPDLEPYHHPKPNPNLCSELVRPC